MFKHSITDLLKQLGVAALYASLLRIGESHFESGGAVVGYFEPASGLALAALLIGGKRYAWSILLGAFLIHATTDDSLWEAVTIASGDTLQALCGTWLLTRDGRFDLRLQSLRDYLRLILFGGAVSIAVGALIANTLLVVFGLLTPKNYFHSLVQWWMGDTLGVILIAPLILAWLGARKDWRTAGMMAEAALILGLAILACQAIFLGWWPDNAGIDAKGYWMFLIVTWVAIRIGACGTTVVLAMTATYALLGAIHGVGYFAHDIAKAHLVNYWLYTVILSVVGMALATHFTERRQLEQQLSSRLRHRDIMEDISQIGLNSTNIENLLEKVLDRMLVAFNADRAYFLYPCNPGAPSWSVPMERTRSEWPGAFARGMVIPMTPEAAEVFRDLLASTEPLTYGHTASRCIPTAVAEQFSIRSMIQMVLRPRTGNPWVIGLHHCVQARAYDDDDLLIFKDIGLRVADALNSLIILKNMRESEENLRRAQAVGQVGSWLLNIATNRLEWSAETYRIFGIPQQQPVDLETFAAATHPDDRDFVLKAWGEAMAGAPYDIEHRIVVDGQTRWVRERAQIERDSEGRLLTGVGTVQDITQSRKVEEKLRTLSTAVEQSPLSVVITDLDAMIQYVNPHFTNATGYSREEIIGQNPRILQSGQTPKETYVELWNALTNGKIWRGELINKRKNGELYWEEAHIVPVVNAAGATTHYVAVKLEITERKKAELALKQYKVVIDTVNDGFWITDAMGNMLEANAAYAKMSGYSVDELVNMHASQLEAIEQSMEKMRVHIEKGIARGHERFETRHRHKGGHEIDVEVSATFMPELQQFFVFIHDITKRKQAEAGLIEGEASIRAILDNSPYLSWLKGIDGRYVRVNKAYVDYTGLGDIRQIIGKTDFDLWPKELAEKYRNDDAEIIATRQQKHVEEMSFDGSKEHWVETFKTSIIDKNGNVLGTVGFSRDITERKQAEEKISNLAFYDPLTQLPNRRLLNDRLGQMLATSKRSGHYNALMFLDLDNFKPLNDTYGHDVGDLLLIEVAHRLTGCVREVDTVARFGGDEFVVMLGELDADKAESTAQAGIVAEKIRSTLAELYLLKIQQEGKAETTVEHHCAASIGVVVFNSESSPEDVLKWADMAMYQAKERGRNRVHFYSS